MKGIGIAVVAICIGAAGMFIQGAMKDTISKKDAQYVKEKCAEYGLLYKEYRNPDSGKITEAECGAHDHEHYTTGQQEIHRELTQAELFHQMEVCLTRAEKAGEVKRGRYMDYNDYATLKVHAVWGGVTAVFCRY